MSGEKKCGLCRHWGNPITQSGKLAKCQRDQDRQPITSRDGSCGDWSAKAEKQEVIRD